MSIFLLIVGLILFVGLVVVHEWGHFIMARRNGVEVEEFSIFFPPRLYSRQTKAGWKFSIGLLPLGGFVKLKGEHDTDTAPHSYGAASLLAKSKIMAAGVAMNLFTAFILLMILALIGIPHLVKDQFTVASDTKYLSHATYQVHAGTVEKDSPADKAGIKVDDTILGLGPLGKQEAVSDPEELPKLTSKYAGQTVMIRFTHNNAQQQRQITLRSKADIQAAKKSGKDVGYLGVSVYQTQGSLTITRSTWSAPVVALGLIKQYTVLTFQGLGKALVGLAGTIAGGVTGNKEARQAAQTEASSQVSGPVGIFFVFKYGAQLGYRFILLVVAIISLTLAIMNILPIPALDGGRLWITLFTRAVKRPLSPHREEVINGAGFMALMALIVLITIVDVRRFF